MDAKSFRAQAHAWHYRSVARNAVRALRDETAPIALAETLAAVNAGLATTVLHPAERKRLEGIRSVAKLAGRGRDELAIGKARKNAWAAECTKLIRLIQFVATGCRAGADGYSIDDCVRHVYWALRVRGETRAAAHVRAHADLVRGAVRALVHPTVGRRTKLSPPTANELLRRLVNANGFANLSLATIKTIRSRRD